MKYEKGQIYGWVDENGVTQVGECLWEGLNVVCVQQKHVPKSQGRVYIDKSKLKYQTAPLTISGSNSFVEVIEQRAAGTKVETRPTESYSIALAAKDGVYSTCQPPSAPLILTKEQERQIDLARQAAGAALSKLPSPVSDQSAKQDAGKVRWALLLAHMPKALEACVKVREYGEKKYGTSESWKSVEPARYLEAAARHVICAMQGERVNEADGGVNHLAQAIVDLLFALEIESKKA